MTEESILHLAGCGGFHDHGPSRQFRGFFTQMMLADGRLDAITAV